MELRDRSTEVVLAELQQVRVVTISDRPEDHLAVSGALAAPAVGDVGTIVAINATPGRPAVYTVESVQPDGRTRWVADFTAQELVPFTSAV